MSLETLARKSQRRKRRGINQFEGKAHPRPVDFFANGSDFLCVLLAAIGFTTEAIAKRTNLTESQVQYRLWKAEQKERANGQLTSRTAYRQGKSDVARMVVSQFTGQRSQVKKIVTKKLDRKGLYSPQPSGVMTDDNSH
jgi:hypothetical protein